MDCPEILEEFEAKWNENKKSRSRPGGSSRRSKQRATAAAANQNASMDLPDELNHFDEAAKPVEGFSAPKNKKKNKITLVVSHMLSNCI